MPHYHFHCIMLPILLLSPFLRSAIAGHGVIGVNYGLMGDNLPPPDQVIALLKSKNIQRIRLFDPNTSVLQALQGSGIQVIVGARNDDLPGLASDKSFATNWVKRYVAPYASGIKFRCISLGNEVILIPPLAQSVLPAMKNLRSALHAANLSIAVSTAVQENVVSNSYPPSRTQLNPDAASYMVPIVQFLEENKYPLLCNIYPYFAYVNDQQNIKADFAMFNTKNVVLWDQSLGYANLLDAKVDATYWALEKVGAGNVEIVLSETGWPSAGGEGSLETIGNARMYNNNLISHVRSGSGTPKKPGKGIEAYLFAVFNENLKPAGIEQNWGLFYPNKTEVYPVHFPQVYLRKDV